MPPTERTDAEHENAHRGGASPTVVSANQPKISPMVPGSSSPTERTSSPESKQNLHQAPTPPDRQRTAQACDKCRERKTKCSGDHPVCNRCTTRGLICQYSSRESRPRGPSKARLRNAMSSLDLHPPPKETTNVQGHLEKSMSERYCARPFIGGGHPDRVHRRASMPQSGHDFSKFRPVPMTRSDTQSFGGMPVTGYEPSFGGATTTRLQHTPHQQFSDNNRQRWLDIPHVQSHIPSEDNTAIQFGLHTPPPLPMVGSHSFSPFSPHGRVSPTFQQPLPLLERTGVGQFESFDFHKTQPVDQMYSWGYHSDSGSSGSSTRESLTYSPISSEDAPEPMSRSASSQGFGSCGPLDLAQVHQQSQFQYSTLIDGQVYPSPAFLPFTPFHGVGLDPDQETQSRLEFTYPSPISPIGVNIMQEDLNFKQVFFDYLGAELRTGNKVVEGGFTPPIEAVH